MTSPALTWTILAIVFVSAFTRSALGFGDGLIAMPLLAIVAGMHIATPLVALCASTIALTILLRAWREVDLKAAWRLIASSLAGIPIGLLFLKTAPEALVKGMLGAVLIAFALYNLVAPRLPTLHGERWSYLCGFVAGILGGAYNTNGPPVVIYGMLRRWSPRRFRATLQGYFFPTGLGILVGHGLAGLWTPEVLRLYLYALPVIVAAVAAGGWVNRRVTAGQFDRFVYIGLLVMGILLFV